MTYIQIKASQIQEVLLVTTTVEGKGRLSKYYDSFHQLEGVPIIEKTNNEAFRLITYYENYQFYNDFKTNVLFECDLRTFMNDEERYLTLLKQLFHGKARSAKKDKHYVINRLNNTLPVERIASSLDIKVTEVTEFIFENDKYKRYLEQGIEDNRGSITKEIANYLKNYSIFKEETEDYILYLGKRLTRSYWNCIKFILLSISPRFSWLSPDEQIALLKEMKDPGMDILSNYFRNRCEELLNRPTSGDEPVQPNIQ